MLLRKIVQSTFCTPELMAEITAVVIARGSHKSPRGTEWINLFRTRISPCAHGF